MHWGCDWKAEEGPTLLATKGQLQPPLQGPTFKARTAAESDPPAPHPSL